ncbi:UNVERIFIED_ORG: hypothetical protein J2W87_002812 [Pseudomonas putida]|jgi:hypothetical protein|uniref:hypothetical protein n=1 Tax=Pseudomonas sp. GM33 TaxID=1144329 RepID=UPI0012FB839E|nr:hypothetical protein [Pseudomonas sp. GM33]MDP9654884.1 hypothetical protein [Pseudomonas putida]
MHARFPVGVAAGCDLLILIFDNVEGAQDQDQKIAAFGSSYSGSALAKSDPQQG